MTTKQKKLRAQIKRDWGIKGIVHALRSREWEKTAPHRLNRLVSIAGDSAFTRTVQNSVTEEEWSDAEEKGITHEIENDYADAFGDVLREAMGEAEGEHVYVARDASAGVWYAGQYKKG